MLRNGKAQHSGGEDRGLELVDGGIADLGSGGRHGVLQNVQCIMVLTMHSRQYILGDCRKGGSVTSGNCMSSGIVYTRYKGIVYKGAIHNIICRQDRGLEAWRWQNPRPGAGSYP